jgi:hypothetical protein
VFHSSGTDVSAGYVTKPIHIVPALEDAVHISQLRTDVTIKFAFAGRAHVLAPEWEDTVLTLELVEQASAFTANTVVRLMFGVKACYLRVLRVIVQDEALIVRVERVNHYLWQGMCSPCGLCRPHVTLLLVSGRFCLLVRGAVTVRRLDCFCPGQPGCLCMSLQHARHTVLALFICVPVCLIMRTLIVGPTAQAWVAQSSGEPEMHFFALAIRQSAFVVSPQPTRLSAGAVQFLCRSCPKPFK